VVTASIVKDYVRSDGDNPYPNNPGDPWSIYFKHDGETYTANIDVDPFGIDIDEDGKAHDIDWDALFDCAAMDEACQEIADLANEAQ